MYVQRISPKLLSVDGIKSLWDVANIIPINSLFKEFKTIGEKATFGFANLA